MEAIYIHIKSTLIIIIDCRNIQKIVFYYLKIYYYIKFVLYIWNMNLNQNEQRYIGIFSAT